MVAGTAVEASALAPRARLARRRFVAGPLLRLRSDDQLLALYRAGHDEAFGVLHERYRSRLLAYARQMLAGSQAEPEDILQDVFMRAADVLREDDRKVTVRPWLYRVAHNRCIDELRRPKPSQADLADVSRLPTSDPVDITQRREELRRLVADVAQLPEQQRSALLMRELEGLSYRELSEALGVSVGAVKSLLVRARVSLVEAGEARDATCAEIRSELAAAHDAGRRASGRTRRHLRYCSGCRAYRERLRAVGQGLNGLAPSPGPLATLWKLLGLGGVGSSGAAGGATVVGGGATVSCGGAAVAGATVSSGIVAATGTKVAAVVAAAALLGGGATTVERVTHGAPAAEAGSAATGAARPAARTHAPAAGKATSGAAGKRDEARRPATATVEPAPLAVAVIEPDEAAVSDAEHPSGGLLAPDPVEKQPVDAAPTTTAESGARPGPPAPSGAQPESGSAPTTDGGATASPAPPAVPAGQAPAPAPPASPGARTAEPAR